MAINLWRKEESLIFYRRDASLKSEGEGGEGGYKGNAVAEMTRDGWAGEKFACEVVQDIKVGDLKYDR